MLRSVPTPDDPEIRTLARWIESSPRILFVTGAGISADSGLPTYRGVGGLYEGAGTEDGIEIEVALSGPMLARQPEICWKYIHQVEQACRGAQPNRAHEVIARLQREREGVVVLTQNVDGLHLDAGCDDVIEMHGNVHDLSCTRCDHAERVPDYEAISIPPQCPRCGALVRPQVVLFGEMLPLPALDRLRREVEQGFSLVVVVGTTAAFPYIAAPVHLAVRQGAYTAEINPGVSEVSEVVQLRLPTRAAPTFDALAVALGHG